MTKEEFASWLLEKRNEAMKGYDEARKMKREAIDSKTKNDYQAIQDCYNVRKNFAEDILVKLSDTRWDK